jgi:hypothetical protein
MARPKRKAVPLAIKAAVLIRQKHHCAECGFPFTPQNKIEYDHRPALILRAVNSDGTDYWPRQNDPDHIQALHSDCHLRLTVGRIPGAERTITTKGSDAHLAKKFRRLERASDSSAKLRHPKQKLKSRGFGKVSRPFKKRERQ